MNFGGIHFLYGLSFLILTILLSTAYVYCGYVLLVACENLLYRYRKSVALNKYIAGQGPDPDESVELPKHKYWNRPFLIRALILVFVFQGVLYIGQRNHWMGSESAHLEAKEYWVAGQVVFAHRKIAEKYLHPENPMTWAYTKLQKLVYQKGTALLPKDDGEVGVWQNQWFLYLYARKSRRPYGVGDLKMEPKMIPLLNNCWTALEQMATKPFEDSLMERQYLLSYPALARYYNTHDGHYTGKLYDSGTLARKNSTIMRRLKMLIAWLNALDTKWNSTGLREILNEKYSVVLATKFGTEMAIVHEIIFSKALHRKLRCDDIMVHRFHEMFKIAMSDDISKNSILLYNLENRKQAKSIYKSTVYSVKGCSGRYLLTKGCNLTLPKEKYSVINPTDGLFEYSEREILSLYKEELAGIRDLRTN